MKISELLAEGGWDTTKTQNTVLNPRVVSVALQTVDKFVADFNQYIADKNFGQVRRGRPTGSSAYHERDTVQDPDKVYGDIDLQMIAPEQPGLTYGQFTTFWNNLTDQFVKTGIDYVDVSESKPGHPIFQIGQSDYVQIDFMWHPERLEKWGATRVTPEHGVKGLLTGNMWSVFGELMNMSVQHAGVQLKIAQGQHVPFSKQKDTEIVTVTTNPESFIADTFKYLAKQQGIERPRMTPALKTYGGVNLADVKIAHMVRGMKEFALSAEANNMFGQGALENYSSASDFLNKFWARYEEKAMIDIAGKKRDKAATPSAIARAEADRAKILQGLETVKGYFQ